MNLLHTLRTGIIATLALPFAIPSPAATTAPLPPASVILVTGAGGTDEYAAEFATWTTNWVNATEAGHATLHRISPGDETDRNLKALEKAITEETSESTAPLWIVLIGHGTFDGRTAKFNLTGDDLAAEQLAKWLEPVRRPVVVVAAFSTSGAFLKPLSGPNRVVIASTKSGGEVNYSRFGGFLATALLDPASDRDKDGQVSALEAWLSAARMTAEFYENDGRIPSEHSLMEDNGDGLGTPADWYQGVRAVKKPAKGSVDGTLARQIHLIPSAADLALTPQQRVARDRLEREIEAIRELKRTLPPEEYWDRLEKKLLELGQLYFGSLKED